MPRIPETQRPELIGDTGSERAAVYVHWPFCAKKCPYCDFNSHVRERIDQDRWRTAMLTEIDTIAALYPNLTAHSVFFGGGTPSLMPPETTTAIIERIHTHWGTEDIEITLEANPSSVEAKRFRAYRAAGVNRLSLGVQSLRDDALKFLGRVHNAKEARKALDVARSHFKRVSFDMIYARPDHINGRQAWADELSTALAFDPVHLSLYQLTIEDGTAFHRQYHRGTFALPGEDEALALLEDTRAMTAAHGLPAYEVSNHAKVGEASQHNLAYWEGRPYVGIGPGAHGRLPSGHNAVATSGIRRPEDWLDAVKARGHGYDCAEMVPARDRMVECIMVGLRLMDGINLKRLEMTTGVSRETVLDVNALNALSIAGYLCQTGDHLVLTHAGQPVLNALLGQILRP